MENNLQLLQDFKALNISIVMTLKNANRELEIVQKCIIQTHLNFDKKLMSSEEYVALVDYYYVQANVTMEYIRGNCKCGLYNYIDSYAYEQYMRSITKVYEEIKAEYYESLEV